MSSSNLVRFVTFATFCTSLFLANVSLAQRYSVEPDFSTGDRFRSVDTGEGHQLVVESRSTRRERCSADLPSVLFSGISAAFNVRLLASSDRSHFVSASFTRGRVFVSTHEIVLQIPREDGPCNVIWQSSYSDAAAGERVIPWSAEGGPPTSVALVVNSGAIAQCGPDQALIQARIYDELDGSFKRKDWRPGLRADSPRIAPAPEPLTDRFADDGIVQYISSDATTSAFTDPRAVPRALTDNDPETVWREGVEGSGLYSFIGGTTRGPIAIVGVRIRVPEMVEGTGVSQWILRTEERDYVLESAGGTDETFLLPGLASPGCFLLFAQEMAADATTIVIGELSLLTELDLGELATPIDQIVGSFEQDDNSPWSRNDAVIVLGSGSLDTNAALADRLPNARFRERGIIVEALASSESGRRELIELIHERKLSERELERVGQVLRQRNVPTDFILNTLDSSDADVVDSLLAFLVESIPPEEADRLLPWAGHPAPDSVIPPINSSPDVAEGLGRGTPNVLSKYLNELDGRAGHDVDILRAILIIARREGSEQRALALPAHAAASIDTALNNENGTVVRLALAVAGQLRIASLTTRMVEIARNDQHPEIRSSAVAALRFFADQSPDATQAVLDGIEDPSPSVRLSAANALRFIRLDEISVGVLGSRLEDEPWPDIRQSLLTALASQPGRAASIRLTQYLEVAPGRDVRKAMIAVQNRTEPLPGNFLIGLFEAHESDTRTQVAIVRTMADTGGRLTSRFLRDRATDKQEEMQIRQAAIETIGRRRTISEVAELILLLQDEDARLRRAAARGLAFFPDERIENAIRQRLEVEEIAEVRNALAASLRSVVQGRSLRDRAEGMTQPTRDSIHPNIE